MAARSSEFVRYVLSFYGPEGLYAQDMAKLGQQAMSEQEVTSALSLYKTKLIARGSEFEGDSVDREGLRDLVLARRQNPSSWEACVASDLFDAGRTEDGRPFTGERFYVELQNAAGKRFMSQQFFDGTKRTVDEETGEPHFPDLREQARAQAAELADKINSDLGSPQAPWAQIEGFEPFVAWGGHWQETDPAYGSDEYIAQGTEIKRLQAERSQ